jgi:hypothetical protein
MTRRKGEPTSRTNERDYPYIVEMPLPEGGFGKTLDVMEAFHRDAVLNLIAGAAFAESAGTSAGGVLVMQRRQRHSASSLEELHSS